jgi:hypothetical protein
MKCIILLFLMSTVVSSETLPTSNLILKFNKILQDENKRNTIGVYDVSPYNETQEIPFNLGHELEIKFLESVYADKSKIGYVENFRSKTKEWMRSSTRMTCPIDLFTMGFQSVQQVKIGDILSEIYKCWSPMEEYTAKTLNYNDFDRKSFTFTQSEGLQNVTFFVTVPVYWLISKGDSLDFDNDKHFSEFMVECKRIPVKDPLLMMLFGVLVVVAFAIYLREFGVFIYERFANYLRGNTEVIDLRAERGEGVAESVIDQPPRSRVAWA